MWDNQRFIDKSVSNALKGFPLSVADCHFSIKAIKSCLHAAAFPNVTMKFCKEGFP